MASFPIYFVLFKQFYRKTIFGIRSWIIRIEGNHADHTFVAKEYVTMVVQ